MFDLRAQDDGPQRRGIVPVGLVVWGLVLVIRGYSQKNAAARVTNPKDSSESRWVDRA